MSYTRELHTNKQSAESSFWRAQRMVLPILAGLLGLVYLGLTGAGGASSYDTVGDAAFTVKYPVVLRKQKQGTITVTPAQPHAQTVLHFDREFLDTFTILATSPELTNAFETSWGVAYHFGQATGSDANKLGTVRIVVSSATVGLSSYTVVVDGRMAMLSTMIAP